MGEGDYQVHGAEMLRRHRIGRFCEEARDQGGLLTQEDLDQILSRDARTNRRDIKALKDLGIHIPTRGQQKDIGPTLTHKKIILLKLIFEGKNVQTVCRETDHSPEAVLRYTTNFKQVLMCRSKGLDVAQTSFATKLSARLIAEHLALIEEYRQRYANLPDGESAQLQQIIERLDQSTKPSRPPARQPHEPLTLQPHRTYTTARTGALVLYSPKLSDVIRALYREGQRRRLPMTHLTDDLLRRSLGGEFAGMASPPLIDPDQVVIRMKDAASPGILNHQFNPEARRPPFTGLFRFNPQINHHHGHQIKCKLQ